jgi:hypothetical protein
MTHFAETFAKQFRHTLLVFDYQDIHDLPVDVGRPIWADNATFYWTVGEELLKADGRRDFNGKSQGCRKAKACSPQGGSSSRDREASGQARSLEKG